MSPIDCMWFLNDDQGYRQSTVNRVFPDLIRTMNLNIKQFRSRFQKDNLLKQLTEESPFLVWIRMPGQATVTGTKQDVHNSRFVASIFRIRLQQNKPCIVESSVHNALWSQIAIKELIDEGVVHLDEIRWCNLGIVHPQNSKPSNMKIACVSNITFPDVCVCACGKSRSEHLMDRKHDLDMFSNTDVRFQEARELMTNQFLCVFFV